MKHEILWKYEFLRWKLRLNCRNFGVDSTSIQFNYMKMIYCHCFLLLCKRTTRLLSVQKGDNNSEAIFRNVILSIHWSSSLLLFLLLMLSSTANVITKVHGSESFIRTPMWLSRVVLQYDTFQVSRLLWLDMNRRLDETANNTISRS